jgi:hypothetical protein
VTKEELIGCGVRRDIKKTELGNVLETLYPHINWTRLHQWNGRFSQQRHFQRVVSSLFEVNFSFFFFSLSLKQEVIVTQIYIYIICECVSFDGISTNHTHTQDEEMKVNVRKETSLRNDVTGAALELDVWFPRLHLAFEFQVILFCLCLCLM